MMRLFITFSKKENKAATSISSYFFQVKGSVDSNLAESTTTNNEVSKTYNFVINYFPIEWITL